MKEKTVKIRFNNKVNPKSTFDLLSLEELYQRKYLDHNIEKSHKVEFYLILLITEGNGCHTIDFTDYKLERGTLLTIRKDQIHSFFKSDSIKGYLFLFTDEFLISYLEKLEAQKSLQLFNELLGVPKIQLLETELDTVKDIASRIENEYFSVMDEYSLGIIRSELHVLVTKLYRIKSKGNQLFANKKYLTEFLTFQKLVEDNVNETTRVSEYAEMMSISTKTLNTISKSIVHKTAKEFIDEVSIKQIKRLLINTSLSIKEIAYTTGFIETTNFYKYFKRLVNCTPEQFRDSF